VVREVWRPLGSALTLFALLNVNSNTLNDFCLRGTDRRSSTVYRHTSDLGCRVAVGKDNCIGAYFRSLFL